MSRITGKVVAVTGASSGIGEATARVLGERGAKVVLGARRVAQLDEIAAELRDRGGQAIACATDVARRDDLERLVGTAVSEFGRLDVLVSNAGISKIGPMSDLDIEGWSAMIDINLKGVLHGIAAALPVFRRQGNGQFVTTVSTAGLKIVPNMGVYAATKNASAQCWRDFVKSPPTAWSALPLYRRDSSTRTSTARLTTRRYARRSAETWMPSVFLPKRWRKPSRSRSTNRPAWRSERSPSADGANRVGTEPGKAGAAGETVRAPGERRQQPVAGDDTQDESGEQPRRPRPGGRHAGASRPGGRGATPEPARSGSHRRGGTAPSPGTRQPAHHRPRGHRESRRAGHRRHPPPRRPRVDPKGTPPIGREAGPDPHRPPAAPPAHR